MENLQDYSDHSQESPTKEEEGSQSESPNKDQSESEREMQNKESNVELYRRIQREPRRITRSLLKHLSGEDYPSRSIMAVNYLPEVFRTVMASMSNEERILYNEGKVQYLLMMLYQDREFKSSFGSKEDFANHILKTVRSDDKYMNTNRTDETVQGAEVHEKYNNTNRVTEVIKRYEELHNSLAEKQKRGMRTKIPIKHVWTREEIDSFQEINKKYPKNNHKIAEQMGLHVNHIVYFKLMLQNRRKNKNKSNAPLRPSRKIQEDEDDSE
eukprot:TRINITY_DN5037_c0_g1_i1.p1 TRINITY_DN5037_c0_g1~~TRINITY_DN5037_c0_g1_i1.p1  ORF type:complete len:269 (-),score=79.12 TRINITY_DN5037_c0_g1_i1:70-876(-)